MVFLSDHFRRAHNTQAMPYKRFDGSREGIVVQKYSVKNKSNPLHPLVTNESNLSYLIYETCRHTVYFRRLAPVEKTKMLEKRKTPTKFLHFALKIIRIAFLELIWQKCGKTCNFNLKSKNKIFKMLEILTNLASTSITDISKTIHAIPIIFSALKPANFSLKK